MQLLYTARFLRSLKKLSVNTKEEVIATIVLFEDAPKHPLLKLRKLSGKWKGYHAISVGFRYRIILKVTKKETHCMDIGTHDVYE